MNLGERIKKRREELGMSQEILAQKLNYKSRSSINKIELGLNDISQSKIMDFAKALRTSPAYLMGWEDTENQQTMLPQKITEDVTVYPIIGEITRFYGIIIKMFFKPKEHEPSHIHALYGEYVGIFDLNTLKMIEGDLPNKAQMLVYEWLSIYRDDLKKVWDSQSIKKLPLLN